MIPSLFLATSSPSCVPLRPAIDICVQPCTLMNRIENCHSAPFLEQSHALCVLNSVQEKLVRELHKRSMMHMHTRVSPTVSTATLIQMCVHRRNVASSWYQSNAGALCTRTQANNYLGPPFSIQRMFLTLLLKPVHHCKRQAPLRSLP